MVVAPEDRARAHRAVLPRGLLGPAGLGRPLRLAHLHPAPGAAAGRERVALQLHTPGGAERRRPQRLVGRIDTFTLGAQVPSAVQITLARSGDLVTASVQSSSAK